MSMFSPKELTTILYQPPEEIAQWKAEKAIFYKQYSQRPSRNEDTNHYPRFDILPTQNPKTLLSSHTNHLKNPTLALIGVGSFRQQSLEYRYAQSMNPSKIIAIEPRATPEKIQLPFTHYRYDITDPLPHTLLEIAHVASLFDSVIMDIAPGLIIPAFIHLNQLLKNGGIIAFDINLDYQEEVRQYHAQHSKEPIGIFKRTWTGKSPRHPIEGKFMRVDETLLHSLATNSGFSHLQSYSLTTTSFPGGQRRNHPRLTSIWQKTKTPDLA